MKVNDLVTANADQHQSGTKLFKKVSGGVAQLVRARACHRKTDHLLSFY